MKNNSKPGPKSKVTVALVKRVSKRVARGLPIRLALSGEPVTQDAYERHLRRHPELAVIQTKAKIEFLDIALLAICSKPGPMLRWLLERRHSDVFGPNADKIPDDLEPDTELTPQSQSIAGVPRENVEAARQYAQSL